MTAQPLDEMVDGAGGFRPVWRRLLGMLVSLGWDTIAERAQQLDRALADAADDDTAAPRCDPIPLILDPAEFAALSAGLAQRATLIEAVLADIYGQQRLLADGLLPPALVFANPAFLRPCRDTAGTRRHPYLQLYAADLMRGADGAWHVVADRTAMPNGLAQVVEARAQLAHAAPELFRGHALLRPRDFFDLWQDVLQQLAPAGGPTPGVAVLGAGPASPHWAECMVLARELGCALVEGGDLTLRDGTLFLKTLRGLSRVDVLLRRQDGRTIDPLELEPDTGPGVAGLLDAARADAVRIVNDPGAGLAEAPALAAVLPALAPRLLGERLRLPSATTLWLGDPAARELVLRDLSPWLVRRALDGTEPSVRPAALAPAARAALTQRILADPEGFAAAAALPGSLAPCLGRDAAGGANLSSCPIALRMFLLFDGSAWRALGGGLARQLDPALPGSGRRGPVALVKDVWVAADAAEGVVPTTMGPQPFAVPALPIRRATADLPSRAADDFFWLGRHLERLECDARLLRIATQRLARAAPTLREGVALTLLAAMLARASLIEKEAAAGLSPDALGQLVFAAVRVGGPIADDLAAVARLAGLLRDRLTGEMQAALGPGLREVVANLPPARVTRTDTATTAGLIRITTATLGFTATVAGLVAENMVRGGGRLFLDLGRRVERAQTTARLLAVALRPPAGPAPLAPPAQAGRLEPGLALVLELCDSVLTYRGRYHSLLQPGPVLDLALSDPGNPRALGFQLAALRDLLAELETSAEAPLAATSETLRAQTLAMVDETVATPAQAEAASALPPRLEALATAIAALSERVARSYFTLLPAPQRIGPPVPDALPLRGAA